MGPKNNSEYLYFVIGLSERSQHRRSFKGAGYNAKYLGDTYKLKCFGVLKFGVDCDAGNHIGLGWI